MKNEKPIIFSGDMIQSIKNTKPGVWPAEPIDPEKPFKGMTRRVIKPQPFIIQKADPGHIDVWGWEFAKNDGMHWTEVSLPRKQEEICEHSRYKIGNMLWVKEIFCKYTPINQAPRSRFSPCEETFCVYGYKADENLPAGSRWKSPLYMPRVASRFLLEVKSVRIERVQSIPNRDVMAEGINESDLQILCEKFFDASICNLTSASNPTKTEDCYDCKNTKKNQFKVLWDTINAKRCYSWEVNPWVYVIEFMRVK
ncbi:phage-like protein [Spirochaetia bacterium]|nr:phage-like protein [Spirochaetia bacterium]